MNERYKPLGMFAMLEEEADRILESAGTPMPQHFIEKSQVFDPFTGAGISLRHVPEVPSMYQPTGDSRPPAKTKGRACEKCGKPRSKYAASVCRDCYTKGAVKRYESRISDKWTRVQTHFQKYSLLLEHYVDIWMGFGGRTTEDFSRTWVNDISRWEEYVGVPFVFWRDEIQFLAIEDARELPRHGRAIKRATPMKQQQWRRQLQSAWRYS